MSQRHLQSCEATQVSELWSRKFSTAREASQQLTQLTMLPSPMGHEVVLVRPSESSAIACAASRYLEKPFSHRAFTPAQCMAAFGMYSTTYRRFLLDLYLSAFRKSSIPSIWATPHIPVSSHLQNELKHYLGIFIFIFIRFWSLIKAFKVRLHKTAVCYFLVLLKPSTLLLK